MAQGFIMSFHLLRSFKDEAIQIYSSWGWKSKFFKAFHGELSKRNKQNKKKPKKTAWKDPNALITCGASTCWRWRTFGVKLLLPPVRSSCQHLAPHWRWMSVLPANDTRAVTCHCPLVGLSNFLYNSVITGHRNSLGSPVVVAPSWDIRNPDLILLNEAKNGFEQGVPMS